MSIRTGGATKVAPTPQEIGKAIRLGREKGLEVRHRPSGWSIKTPSGQQTNYYPAMAAEFIRAIEVYGETPRYDLLPEDVRTMAQGLHDIQKALGFDMDGDENPGAEIAAAGYDVALWAKGVVEDIIEAIEEELADDAA